MVEVVDKALFEEKVSQLTARLERMEQELQLYRQLLPATEWISRREAMKFLCCGETKLWELTKFNRVKTRKVGSKILYNTDSLRAYLEGRGVSQEVVNQQFTHAVRKYI